MEPQVVGTSGAFSAALKMLMVMPPFQILLLGVGCSAVLVFSLILIWRHSREREGGKI